MGYVLGIVCFAALLAEALRVQGADAIAFFAFVALLVAAMMHDMRGKKSESADVNDLRD